MFQRTGKFPLDRSSMFSSYEDALKYAKGDSADPDSRGLQGSSYVGQIITVYENDVVNVYKIDANRNLSAIGSGGGGGGTSDYSELENKPSINNVTLNGNKTSNDLGLQPAGDYALRSEIPDVSNFITVTVDNLVNYYLKSETYNKQEVNSLISAISTATFEVVNELPETGENNVIYLVPSTNPQTRNIKDEFVWTNNAWEQIGSTSVNLTGYATETWVNTQIANFLTQAQIELLINTAIANVNTSINDINSKIPNQASQNNQLADKDFVNSSISTATATFRGTFTSLNTLQATEGDKNDYAFYSHQDSSGNTIYDRYKYVGPKEVILPAGYTQVGRIAGNYINLNILPRNDWHFILKVSSPYFADRAPAVPVFGANMNSGGVRYDMYKPSYEYPLYLKTTVGQWGTQVSNNDIHTIEVKSSRAMYIDGSLVGNLSSTTNLPTIPVYLLGVNTNGSAWIQSNVHCYGLTIYDNEENLLMDLVPCIRDQDGSIGVYDLAGTINPDTNSPFYGGATSSSPLSEDKWEYEYSLNNSSFTSEQWASINSGVTAQTATDITTINSKIPSQASSTNQLADKDFVESAISTATASFRGTYTSLPTLQAVDGDRNDYAFYSHQDSSGNTIYDRYKYVGLPDSRVPEGYTERLNITQTRYESSYIDTGYKVQSTDKVVIKYYGFEYTATAALLLGAKDSNNNYIQLRKDYGSPNIYLETNNGSVSLGPGYNKSFIIEAYDGKVYMSDIDGQNKQLKGTLALSSVDANLYVFRSNNNGTPAAAYDQRISIGDFTIYDSNSDKVLELVPCTNSLSVNGYYETVTGRFIEPIDGTLNAQAISTDKWLFEYSLNNSSFTSAQWAALNSGLVAHVTANGYDATKTQVLKNINGTLTWVDET